MSVIQTLGALGVDSLEKPLLWNDGLNDPKCLLGTLFNYSPLDATVKTDLEITPVIRLLSR